MPLAVSAHALIGSSERLRTSADRLTDQASHLLRFYAVECGLKAVLLRQRNLRTTAQLEIAHHDIRRLAIELNLAHSTYRHLRRCRHRGPASTDPPVEPAHVHEAWRYGVSLDAEDERQFVAGLKEVEQWCRERLGR